MAHLNSTSTPVERRDGNTRSTSPERQSGKSSTYWFITYHIRDELKCAALFDEFWANIISLRNLKWAVAQLEETKSRGIHVQASIGFKRTERMFEKLRKQFPGIHVEITKNWKWSQSYCCKLDTRRAGTEPKFFPPTLKDEVNPWGGGKVTDTVVAPTETASTPGPKHKDTSYSKADIAHFIAIGKHAVLHLERERLKRLRELSGPSKEENLAFIAVLNERSLQYTKERDDLFEIWDDLTARKLVTPVPDLPVPDLPVPVEPGPVFGPEVPQLPRVLGPNHEAERLGAINTFIALDEK